MTGLGAASPALAQGPLRAQAQAQPQSARAAALQRLFAPDAETRLAAVRRPVAQIQRRRGDVEQALKADERPLEVNPNLEGGPGFLRMLQEAVRERRNAAAGRST